MPQQIYQGSRLGTPYCINRLPRPYKYAKNLDFLNYIINSTDIYKNGVWVHYLLHVHKFLDVQWQNSVGPVVAAMTWHHKLFLFYIKSTHTEARVCRSSCSLRLPQAFLWKWSSTEQNGRNFKGSCVNQHFQHLFSDQARELVSIISGMQPYISLISVHKMLQMRP